MFVLQSGYRKIRRQLKYAAGTNTLAAEIISGVPSSNYASLCSAARRDAAVVTTAERFRGFWADKTTPMSRYQTPEAFHLVARELKLLFGERHPLSVLEVGCGNGCLFDFLDFSPTFYRGIDFGPRMLEVFRSNHPELDLLEAEGSSYLDDRTYDLIFAHDVIAHFSLDMLAQHCRNARRMMHSESRLVWACVPWRVLRNSYDLGVWSQDGANIRRWGKSRIHRMLGRDLMGRWYTITEIAGIAKQNSLTASFHGSITHPYRFHAVMQPDRAWTFNRSLD